MSSTSFVSGYLQDQPYHIRLVGPNPTLCKQFFCAFRAALTESSSRDRVSESGEKSVTVVRRPRTADEGQILYKLTCDPDILNEDPTTVPLAHDDAYIVLFDDMSAPEFNAVEQRHVDHVLDLCSRNQRDCKRALQLVAHRSDPCCRTTVYSGSSLAKLLARSHASFLRITVNVPHTCATTVDTLVRFLIKIHSCETASTTQSIYRARAAPSAGLAAWLDDLQQRLLPMCMPTNYDDPDAPRPWSDEEIALQRVTNPNRGTPMGEALYK